MALEKSSFGRFVNRTTNSVPSQSSSSPAGINIPNRNASFSGAAARPGSSRTSAIFEIIISVSLVALFFGLPLFFTGSTFQGIAFEKQIYLYFWLLVGLVAWVSKGVLSGEMRIRRTPFDIPIILFWLFYLVSAFFSVDRWHSFWGFFGDPSRGVISVTALILLYYLLLSHFTPKRFYWMFGAFLVSSFLVVVWSFLVLMEIKFLPATWEQIAPISLIGTLSTLTIFLGLVLPLMLTALFLVWQEGNGLGKKIRMAISALLLAGMLLTLFLLLSLYAYVTWVVVLGGLSFFVVYILAQIVRPAEQWTWAPMLVFVAVLVFLMIGNTSLVRVTLPVEVSPNADLSFQVARDTLKENFFAGVGPANYGYAFSLFRPQEYNLHSLYTLRFYQGDGLFFESLATIGVVGTVLLLIGWLAFLSLGLYLLTHEKRRNKICSLGLFTASLMLFLAAFVAPFNGSLLIIGALIVALTFAVLFWESGTEERYLELSLKAAPKFALALAFIFMVVSAGVAFLFAFMGKVFLADIAAGKAVRLSANNVPSSDAVNLLVRAIGQYPQEGRYYTRLGQEYMALGNAAAAKPESERDINAIAFYVREAVATAEEGRRLMPNDAMAVESLGLLYENGALYASDALPKATELYARAQELEPHNPLYALKLGQIRQLEGDRKEVAAEKAPLYAEAKTYFEQAIAEKQNLPAAYYSLAILQSRLKENDQAIENARRAIQLAPNNPNYEYNLGVLYQLRNAEGDEGRAESLFKNILQKNERLVDVRFTLGLLYEKQRRTSDALSEYEKILTFLPENGGVAIEETRRQIETTISNVRSGRGNLLNSSPPAVGNPVEAPAPLGPTGPAVPPTEPNESPLTPEAP